MLRNRPTWLNGLLAVFCFLGAVIYCVEGGWIAVGAAACWGGFLLYGNAAWGE